MRNLHLGTIGWSYDFWKVNFYPNKTAAKDFLAYYASWFDTVEVDSTFYRIPTVQVVTNWKNQTHPGFMFSLKFPRVITHLKMLRDCERETGFFLYRAELLGEKLGPLLMQFPPNFGVERFDDLADFLQRLPRAYRYVVEVRDGAWLKEEFYSLLKANGAALAWVDRSSMPQVSEVTSDFLYMRWEGDRKKVKGTLGEVEVNTRESLRAWAGRLKPYLRRQMEVFGYFGKYYSGFPPSDINMLLALLE